MKYDPHRADCQTCDWSQSMPSRDTAEHAKRVHEDEHPGHSAVLSPIDEDEA